MAVAVTATIRTSFFALIGYLRLTMGATLESERGSSDRFATGCSLGVQAAGIGDERRWIFVIPAKAGIHFGVWKYRTLTGSPPSRGRQLLPFRIFYRGTRPVLCRCAPCRRGPFRGVPGTRSGRRRRRLPDRGR